MQPLQYAINYDLMLSTQNIAENVRSQKYRMKLHSVNICE